MDEHNWIDDQIKRIEELTAGSSTHAFARYKINWLKKLIRKTSEFQTTCSICSELEPIVEKLIMELETLLKDANHSINPYNEQLKFLERHLRKDHHVVAERHYMHVFTVVGILLGMTVSLVFTERIAGVDKYGLWVFAIAGVLLGSLLDYVARMKGRTL